MIIKPLLMNRSGYAPNHIHYLLCQWSVALFPAMGFYVMCVCPRLCFVIIDGSVFGLGLLGCIKQVVGLGILLV
jgi:hypothetical protein